MSNRKNPKKSLAAKAQFSIRDMAGKLLLTGEQEGFILSDSQSIVNTTSDVETSWGTHKVKAEELTLYVKMADGESYTIKGKRD